MFNIEHRIRRSSCSSMYLANGSPASTTSTMVQICTGICADISAVRRPPHKRQFVVSECGTDLSTDLGRASALGMLIGVGTTDRGVVTFTNKTTRTFNKLCNLDFARVRCLWKRISSSAQSRGISFLVVALVQRVALHCIASHTLSIIADESNEFQEVAYTLSPSGVRQPAS